MDESGESGNLDRPHASEIVRIAYRQSREISGSDNYPEGENTKSEKHEFACTRRLTSLPIVSSLNTRIGEAYASVKTSHAALETTLEKMEEGLGNGGKFIERSKLLEKLPLKSIDALVCEALDHLEEYLPSVKLPPAEIYRNLEERARNCSSTLEKHSTRLYADIKLKLDRLSGAMIPEEPVKSSPESTARSREKTEP